jgi:hypothetical protein
MSLKIGRIAALAATLSAVGAMSVATTSASAYSLIFHLPFKNWVASGTVTPKKLNEPITLPQGSTFNGEAILDAFSLTGTVSGNLYVPPFTAKMKLLGLVPDDVGVKLTQIGAAEGSIAPAPQADCPETTEKVGSACVTLSVPARVQMALTVVGVLGINVPTTCETSEPIAFNLGGYHTLKELYDGPHFTGTVTLPRIECDGLEGATLAPLLTTLISGPENPYALSISPPSK